MKAVPGCTKKDQLHVEPKKARCRSLSFNGSASNTFQPHLTVANRDIPAGVSAAALQVMNELNLVEDFPVDNITIFERKGGKAFPSRPLRWSLPFLADLKRRPATPG